MQGARRAAPEPEQTTDSWRVFRIMGEFVEGFDTLARLGPCDQHRRSWNLPCGEMSAPGGMIVG